MQPPNLNDPMFDRSDDYFKIEDVVDLSSIDNIPNSTRELCAEIDFAEPLSPPPSLDPSELIDIQTPLPVPLRRSNATADLSTAVELSIAASKRDSNIVDTLLGRVRANSFVEAIGLYHELTIRHFKDTAFNEISTKLFATNQISVHINELLKDIPLDKRSEKMFNMASDHMAKTRAKVLMTQARRAADLAKNDVNYKLIYDETQPLINNAISNVVDTYKAMSDDSLRCALIIRLNATLFIFPETPIPSFPIEEIIRERGIKDVEGLKAARREFQSEEVEAIGQVYEKFVNDTTTKAKRNIEFALLRFHLTESRQSSLLSFFRHICEPTMWANLLMFAAVQLIQEEKIDLLASILHAIVEVKNQYSVEDQPKVESMVVQAIVLATKKGRIDLAEQFFTLVPHRKEEILQTIAQG